jgi:hypothetical protein
MHRCYPLILTPSPSSPPIFLVDSDGDFVYFLSETVFHLADTRRSVIIETDLWILLYQ